MINNMSILIEFFCNKCIYFAINIKVIKNHFNKNYKEMKWLKNNKKCKIQLSFTKQLKKYIQIENNNEMKMNINDNNIWKFILKMKFEWNINEININDLNNYNNIQLMKVFIVKIKWNLIIKNINRKKLIELAKMPIIKNSLHAIILYKK